jgi:hypothetical protein
MTVDAICRSAGRRGVPATVTVRRTYIDDLRDELRAAGQEMVIAGQRIEYADRAGRRDLLLQTAARLINRGRGYAR